MRKTNLVFIGVFLISAAALALEISLVRLFSVAQWYHFAFMVVSIALFGIAAAGTFLSIKRVKNPLLISSVLFSFTTIISFFITNSLMFDPYRAILSYLEISKLLFYYLLLGLPFFFFGIIVAFTLSKYKDKAGKIYFYNLTGSAFGSLLAIPLISFLGPKVVIAVTIIGLLSSLCFTNRRKRLVVLILLVCLLFFIPLDINMSSYKELHQALNYPNAGLLFTKWNSFSRVDVVNSSFTRYLPGISSTFRGEIPQQIGITVDGSGMSAITNNRDLGFVNYLPSAIPYVLVNNPKTLVINSGTGLDVLVALYYNATVDAVETNPIVVDLVRDRYRKFAGDIYGKSRVYVGEGRSFVKRGEKYDVIVLSLAGNVLSSSAGLYSLAENYLLTVEAFNDYYKHLTDGGVLVITRWLLYPPRESLRLFSLGLEIPDAKNKIAMFRSWTTVTFLLSKGELSRERISGIKDFMQRNRFDIIYLPGNFTPNKYGKFKEPYYFNAVNNLLKDKGEFYNNYLFDVKPVYDNKPFYFNFFKWEKLSELYKIIGNRWQPFFDSGFLLLFIFVQALILSLIFILLPLRFFRKIRIKKIGLVYFFCIGISYLFVEIVLIQRFILFLRQVIYSTATVIGSMLLFSGLGSLLSQKYKTKRLVKVIVFLFFLIILYSLFLPKLLNMLISLPLITKIFFSILIIAPLAFVMGMPFPLGIRIIHRRLVAWSWAVNGCASVLSPIIAVMIAVAFGYSTVLVLAAFFYLMGVFTLRRLA